MKSPKNCAHANGSIEVATHAGNHRFDGAMLTLKGASLSGPELVILKRDQHGVARHVGAFSPGRWTACADTCADCGRILEFTPQTTLTKDERPQGRRPTRLVKHARPARMAAGADFDASDLGDGLEDAADVIV